MSCLIASKQNDLRSRFVVARYTPERERNEDRIDALLAPKGALVHGVLRPMLVSAERERPGIVWLLAHSSLPLCRSQIGKAQMGRFDRRIVVTKQTWQRPDKIQMRLAFNALHGCGSPSSLQRSIMRFWIGIRSSEVTPQVLRSVRSVSQRERMAV